MKTNASECKGSSMNKRYPTDIFLPRLVYHILPHLPPLCNSPDHFTISIPVFIHIHPLYAALHFQWASATSEVLSLSIRITFDFAKSQTKGEFSLPFQEREKKREKRKRWGKLRRRGSKRSHYETRSERFRQMQESIYGRYLVSEISEKYSFMKSHQMLRRKPLDCGVNYNPKVAKTNPRLARVRAICVRQIAQRYQLRNLYCVFVMYNASFI